MSLQTLPHRLQIFFHFPLLVFTTLSVFSSRVIFIIDKKTTQQQGNTMGMKHQQRWPHSGLTCAMTMGLVACLCPGSASAQTPAAAKVDNLRVSFDIPPQALASAVVAFAEQSGVQVFFDRSTLAGLHSQGLKGQHSVPEALALLLKGLPVKHQMLGQRQLNLERLPDAAAAMQLDSTHVQDLSDRDKVFEVPRSVSTLDREQMNRHPVRNVADLLEETEGVYSAVSQRDPGLSVNIRGVQDYGRVNMNIDGMRQNYSQMGHQQRNGTMYIDPQLLGGIDIYKGSSSGQGGAGVLGGLATFRTLEVHDVLEPGKDIGGRIRASHGLGGEGNGMHFSGSTAFGVRNEAYDLVAAYSERHLGEFYGGRNGTANLSDVIGYQEAYPEAGKQWLKDKAKYTDSVQRSYLMKFGLNLPNDQRLQLSQINTRIGYNDATWRAAESQAAGETIYRLNGSSQVESTSTGLDYSYNPDSERVDFKAKLYYATTRNFQDNAVTLTLPGSVNHYRTDTVGLQVQNTSRFGPGGWGELDYNFGGELFRDQFKPSSYGDMDGLSEKPYADGVDPEGERLMASLFNNITWNYKDWLTVSGGLRYDHYQMNGTAGMTNAGAVEGEYGTQGLTQMFDVDESEGRFSPSIGLALKPGPDWLQLYANYGKGWRPPSVTEVFTSGRPHGGSFERVYPNPYLKPERSRDWEVGVNIFKDSLWLDGDRFTAKVAYFNTRIESFSFLDMAVDLPSSTVPFVGTRLAYVNNLETTRFRGLDYKVGYDVGRYYADLTYTHMIGSNEFCAPFSYLGSALKLDSSDYRTESFTTTTTLASGRVVTRTQNRKTYKYVADDERNRQVLCGSIMGNASYMPADRGALTLGTRLFERKLDVGVRMRYSKGNSKDFKDANYDTLDQALWPRYQVYDAYMSYWPTQNINLGLLIDNFTDQAYITAIGDLNNQTLARGRTLVGSLEYRF